MNNFAKKNKQIIFLLASLAIYISSSYIWTNCLTLNCSESIIDNYLSTIKMTGIVLVLFSLGFLFLPPKYFTSWFKYIFSWAFPLSVLIVATSHNESMGFSIPKSAIVQLLGMVFGVVTFIFVGIQYIRTKNN